jgi:hypothetical protein
LQTLILMFSTLAVAVVQAQATGGRMIGAGSSLESCSSRNTFQL